MIKDYLRKYSSQSVYNTWKQSNRYIEPHIADIKNGNTIIGFEFKKAIPVVQHDYVEIGGIKWATMNLGANSITDGGLYYQWGDTQGYTLSQVGNGAGQKYFGIYDTNDYKYWSSENHEFTKYNDEDGLMTLLPEDDAASVLWGGNWRIPTISEWQILIESSNYIWTNDYQGSGIQGTIFTDKIDNTKVLFLPESEIIERGTYDKNNDVKSIEYWSSSTYSDSGRNGEAAWKIQYSSSASYPQVYMGDRSYGLVIRPILDDSNS